MSSTNLADLPTDGLMKLVMSASYKDSQCSPIPWQWSIKASSMQPPTLRAVCRCVHRTIAKQKLGAKLVVNTEGHVEHSLHGTLASIQMAGKSQHGALLVVQSCSPCCTSCSSRRQQAQHEQCVHRLSHSLLVQIHVWQWASNPAPRDELLIPDCLCMPDPRSTCRESHFMLYLRVLAIVQRRSIRC